IEEGLIQPKTKGVVRMEAPAGLINIQYEQEGKKVKSVTLTNVPSFLHSTSLLADCTELGELVFDVAYGGNFYAIVDTQKNFKGIEYY
ncbi:proline racemase family protein, partial [Acinetobacter baumannii]